MAPPVVRASRRRDREFFVRRLGNFGVAGVEVATASENSEILFRS